MNNFSTITSVLARHRQPFHKISEFSGLYRFDVSMVVLVSAATEFCPAEIDFDLGIIWTESPVGETVRLPCPTGYIGELKARPLRWDLNARVVKPPTPKRGAVVSWFGKSPSRQNLLALGRFSDAALQFREGVAHCRHN